VTILIPNDASYAPLHAALKRLNEIIQAVEEGKVKDGTASLDELYEVGQNDNCLDRDDDIVEPITVFISQLVHVGESVVHEEARVHSDNVFHQIVDEYFIRERPL
jgi:hypothetical protein